jgi:sterol desaturase/sphingolipid hydroxylase (fatty acid hydroxylase superfamily)
MSFSTTATKLLKLTTVIASELGLRYLLFAGAAWLLGYVWFKRRWFHRKIIARFPESSEVRREIAYSAVSVFIFASVAALTLWAARLGWTQIYYPLSRHGWLWFAGSIVCAIVLHDTYFYWTHRLMHLPRLFRWFHRTHHLSRNPTPWAAYAFAPLEGVVQASIFPLTAFLIPIHPLAFAIFMVWQIIFNIFGHMGYEFHPPWLMSSWLGRFMNTPTNHVMHHEFIRGNYGLYFNVWDRIMKTNHAGYEDRFREVTSRTRQKAMSDAEVLSAQNVTALKP